MDRQPGPGSVPFRLGCPLRPLVNPAQSWESGAGPGPRLQGAATADGDGQRWTVPEYTSGPLAPCGAAAGGPQSAPTGPGPGAMAESCWGEARGPLGDSESEG